MKYKVTKKQINAGYNQILGVGCCKLEDLLRFREPIAYSTRAEGWACDYYEIDGLIISTGDEPLASKNINCDYNLIRSYNEKAREITHKYSFKYEEQKEEIEKLLKEFVRKVKEC